jgi:monoamine oxidase
VKRIDTSHPSGRACITYCTTADNTSADETLLADAVICTIPSAVLQQGTIEFHPSLPDMHQSALNALITGRVEKIVLAFDERWWPPATESNGYMRAYGTSFGDVSEWLDCTDAFGVPVISGIFSGPWVEEIWNEGSTPEQVAQKATAALYKAIHTT